MSIRSKALAALRTSIIGVRKARIASVELAKDARDTAKQAWQEDIARCYVCTPQYPEDADYNHHPTCANNPKKS